MNGKDYMLEAMTKEARDELASGEVGWREANPNVLMLAVVGMMFKGLREMLMRPLWLLASGVSVAVIADIVFKVIGG